MRLLTVLTATVLLAGCSSTLRDKTFATGTSTTVAVDSARVFAVNTDEGTVSMVDLATDQVTTIPVGAEPTRLARAGEQIVVTLRADRALAVLDGLTGELQQTVPVGHEPYGVVASEDGRRVYVSISLDGVVQERDGATLELIRTFPTGGEPRWMALHPSGSALYVAHATGAALSWIDLDDGTISDLNLPASVYEALQGANPGLTALDRRVTGDPTLTHDGVLAVPALYVDTRSGEVNNGGLPAFPYYSMGQAGQISRFNAGVVLYRTAPDGTPETVPSAPIQFIGVSADTGRQYRSYITSLTPTPEGLALAATMDASNGVVVFDVTERNRSVLPVSDGWSMPSASVLTTGWGPRGVVYTPEGDAFVHTAFDRGLEPFSARRVLEMTRTQVLSGPGSFTAAVTTDRALPLELPSLPPEVEEGRRLFFSANDDRIGGRGVSCSTCHVESRTDGLTWTLFNGERNTPSLAGDISATAPVTWTNDIETVADEAKFTMVNRMGAVSMTNSRNAEYMQAYVDFTRLPDLPDTLDADAVNRGSVLFARSDVGCITCHSGPTYSDNQPYDMYGIQNVRTRSLLGVAASAPYLHNGSAATLRRVLESAAGGGMGDTSMLSPAELDDLEAFLRSL